MKVYAGRQLIREQLPNILSDESKVSGGVPQKVFFPVGRDDVRSIVKEASLGVAALTIIGGQTGITGGSVPVDDCIAICFSEMGRILGVTQDDRGAPVLHCEPGVTLEKINQFLQYPLAWPYPVEGSDILVKQPYYYPPDPTEMTAHLGGTVATNASGARSFRFGPTRAHIESLSLVLANGDTLSIARGGCTAIQGALSFTTDQGTAFALPLPSYRTAYAKNASGYFAGPGADIVDLCIGSEGTLAVFTEIGIRLQPRPQFIGGLSFFPARQEAFGFASFLRAEKQVAAIEYFDESALLFIDRERSRLACSVPQFPAGGACAVYWEWITQDDCPFEERMDEWDTMLSRFGSSFDKTWSGFDTKEMAQLKAFRHCVPEAVNNAVARHKQLSPDIRKVSTDTALPEPMFEKTIDSFMQTIASSGIEHAMFGHLGDFHLHINLIPHTAQEYALATKTYDELMRMTISAQGTVSAEHGIGKLKVTYLVAMYGGQAIAEMKKIKSILDPQWILNRGTLFAYPP
jgi:D-lactate dehydrogenase (cytochrome)